ncbi:hypothetical protein BGZ65_004559 [Modicella reniformis]|uniref:Protein PBN1 n=1 Tax=Modicella reniformis TaxID=1440133 RepID=A0A9P6IKZ0_9FUNG|nr:hypothetical protein BGZ65_004559 [Modicella reniformis]
MVKLSVSTVALLALSTAATISAQVQSLLQHRHSFVSTLPVEPSDENIKVTHHQVQIVGLSGFREWEVKGSFEGFSKAAGKDCSHQVYIHLLRDSDDFSGAWKQYCPALAELVGAVDCQDHGEDQPLETQGTARINARHLTSIHGHRYLHRHIVPENFLSESSIVSSLISKQQSGPSTGPALIDLVLQNNNAVLKVIWPVGSNGQNEQDNVVTVSFDNQTDKVVEVGWFYREVTEQERNVYDHYMGATVKMDQEGEDVSEALIQARSPVFPPHKREVSTGKVHIPGHSYSSTMNPPQTFHPHSITTIQSNPYIAGATADCDLVVLHVLPPGIFVDPFQLQSLESEIGQATVFGETDLEKPVGVVAGWGSLVMVKVQPEDSVMTSRWITGNLTDTAASNKDLDKTSPYSSTVDIPMHMRYQPPSSEEESSTAAAKKLFHIPTLPLNILFPDEGDKGAVNFRFVLPDPIPKQFPENHVSVPVGRLKDLFLVRAATFVMATAGTLAVSVALVKVVSGRTSGKGKQD